MAIRLTNEEALRQKIVLTQKYIAHLQDLTREFMGQDNIEMAKAVQEERKRAEFVVADMLSKLPQPTVPTKAPEPKPAVPAEPRIPRSVEKGLCLRYPLDEITKGQTIESTRHANPATVIGARLVEKGKVAAAFSFDGKAYLDAGMPTPQQDSLTICAWIKTAQANKPCTILARSHWFSGAWQVKTQYGKAIVECATGGKILSTSNVCDGEWHHIVAAYDTKENTLYLYVDGRLEGQEQPKHRFKENGNELYIGLRPGTTCFFEGLIDDVQIYSHSLSADEVKSLFEAFK